MATSAAVRVVNGKLGAIIFSIVVFLLGVPAPRLGAQPVFTPRECAAEFQMYLQRTGLQPDRDTYYRALRHCDRADLRSAIAEVRRDAVADRACVADLQTFIQRSGLSPDRQTYARAVSHCYRNDLRSAIAEVRRDAVTDRVCVAELEAYLR